MCKTIVKLAANIVEAPAYQFWIKRVTSRKIDLRREGHLSYCTVRLEYRAVQMEDTVRDIPQAVEDGTALLALRHKTKLSQQEVATMLGISRNTVNRWEAGDEWFAIERHGHSWRHLAWLRHFVAAYRLGRALDTGLIRRILSE